ncbi:MAG: phosphoribosyltransferase family protein [Candidatus Pacebacteria bacterium]|nr:phosphoribosyltransferase family protein [Candidatus Paceibacterota bacterium]
MPSNKTEEQWMKEFTQRGSLWIHDGNPKRPHALLTSGGHSNGFFNAIESIKDPDLLDEACDDLLDLLDEEKVVDKSEMVIGSALGAVTIAYQTAKQLVGVSAGWTEEVILDPPEDAPEGVKGIKIMELKRFDIKPGTKILVVEDVMTSGATTEKTIAGIKKKNGIVLPQIAVLFNRSGKTHLGEYEIVALMTHPLENWMSQDCPLCKKGSEAVRPKANWAKLTAAY